MWTIAKQAVDISKNHTFSKCYLSLIYLAVAPARLTTTPGGLIFTGHTSVLQNLI